MATEIQNNRTLTFTEALATPLDGTTTARTFQFVDRVVANCLQLSERCDSVMLDAFCTSAAADGTVAFKIYGYTENGGAKLIYSGTATAGTGVAGTGKLFIDTFSAQSAGNYFDAMSIAGSAANGICSMTFNTRGIKYLMIEPGTFTTITSITFNIREFGTK